MSNPGENPQIVSLKMVVNTARKGAFWSQVEERDLFTVNGGTRWIVEVFLVETCLPMRSMERSYANSGKEWSDMDVADLQQCVKIGMADTDIAGFLRRPTEEIRERAAELVGISLGLGKDNKSDS
jgi:hypothetical protein